MAPSEKSRTALVTGGSSGIGMAIAAAVAGEGYRTALCARNASRLEAAASETGAVLPLVCDVREPESVDRAFSLLEKEFGGLDLLVNNAGVSRFLDLEATSEEDWEAMIGTNLGGTWRVTKRAMPLLLAQRGLVVNVISVAGRRAYPGSSAYCASKFGALGLAESIREEYRERGVRVVNLLPGATDTPLWDRISGDWDRSRMLQPSDLARAVLAAIRMPEHALIEELLVRPAGGDL